LKYCIKTVLPVFELAIPVLEQLMRFLALTVTGIGRCNMNYVICLATGISNQ
jgi:hypothetical protein